MFLTIFNLSANQLRQAEGEREDLVLRRRHSLRGRVRRQRLLETFSQNGKLESESSKTSDFGNVKLFNTIKKKKFIRTLFSRE